MFWGSKNEFMVSKVLISNNNIDSKRSMLVVVRLRLMRDNNRPSIGFLVSEAKF